MPDSTKDRSLHFVVRHDSYKQTMGYRHFLNAVLQDINQREHGNVAELMIDITDRMRLQHPDPIYNGRDYKKLFEYHTGNIYEPFLQNQLEDLDRILATVHRAIEKDGKNPDDFRVRRSPDAETNKIISKLTNKEDELEKLAVEVFGPAGHRNYGRYTADNIIFTPIKHVDEDRSIRAYWHTAKRNLGLEKGIPKGFIKRFEYEIPGSGGKKLPLMRIATFETLGDEKTGDNLFKDTKLYRQLQNIREPDDLWYHPATCRRGGAKRIPHALARKPARPRAQ
ncbi:MAG: hypothetical protein EBV03_09450 [Proteobacteria bacterium]|nr:hypothetical protein [Pseudomonadota bacterium]